MKCVSGTSRSSVQDEKTGLFHCCYAIIAVMLNYYYASQLIKN